MKKFKLLIVFLSIFLMSSCEFKKDINNSLFIASIGFEPNEDGYKGYFYLPLSNDVGKSEGNDSKGHGEFALAYGKNVAEIFTNVENSISMNLNFRHVASIILSEKILKQKFLNELLDYIKYSMATGLNLYFFVTDENLGDIYSFKNPNQESVLNSILISTNNFEDTFLVANPVHLLEFTRRYYKDRTIFLPLIKIEELWNIEGEVVKSIHPQSAIYYYRGNLEKVEKDNENLYMKTDTRFFDQIEETTTYITDYSYEVLYQKNIVFSVSLKYEVYDNSVNITDNDVKNWVKKRIVSHLNKYRLSDPLDLNYHSYVYGKNYDYDHIDVQVKINKN